VEARVASRNLKSQTGRSPGGLWLPVRVATEPQRGDGTLLLVSMVLALGRSIVGFIVSPIALGIDEQ